MIDSKYSKIFYFIHNVLRYTKREYRSLTITNGVQCMHLSFNVCPFSVISIYLPKDEWWHRPYLVLLYRSIAVGCTYCTIHQVLQVHTHYTWTPLKMESHQIKSAFYLLLFIYIFWSLKSVIKVKFIFATHRFSNRYSPFGSGGKHKKTDEIVHTKFSIWFAILF